MDDHIAGAGHYSTPPCGFCGRATVAIDFAAVPAGFCTCNACLHDLAGVPGYRCPVCNFTLHREGCCPRHPPPQVVAPAAGYVTPHQPPSSHEAAPAMPPQPQIAPGAGGPHHPPYNMQQPHQPSPPLALTPYVHQEQPVALPEPDAGHVAGSRRARVKTYVANKMHGGISRFVHKVVGPGKSGGGGGRKRRDDGKEEGEEEEEEGEEDDDEEEDESSSSSEEDDD